MTCDEVIAKLHVLANPIVVKAKQDKFGIVASNSLGVYQKELNAMLKEIPKDDVLALSLFNTGVYEARILCSKIFKPKNVTLELAEQWAKVFDNWEICDSFCLFIFAKSHLALPIIVEWATAQPEFVKRAAFATMAAYCNAAKKEEDATFEQFFPLIIAAATDERLYVKKAVNWALRGIGKRNPYLNQKAIACAKQILALNTPAARWIATDALRELQNKNVRISDYPRAIYRPL